MTESSKPRIRRQAPKVRTGCATCKRRRVKCDETKPACLRCEKLGFTCEGYLAPKAWIFEPRASSSSSSDDGGQDQNSDETNQSTTPSSRPSQDKTVSNLTDSPPPLLVRAIPPNEEHEAFFLIQAYVRMATVCPVAWESDLFNAHPNPEHMTDRDIASLHEQKPVTRVAHLAMATATLHLFQPEIFSSSVKFKYLLLAIAEVRNRIGKRNFDLDDLIHGISQIFLASVLSGDETAARAHLTAAKKLIDQRGGMHKLSPPTTQALRYGDFQLAIETVSPPVFLGRLGLDHRPGLINFEFIDPRILQLSQDLCDSAKGERESLSGPLVQCFCDFAECTIALSQAWNASAANFDLSKLEWIAGNCLGVCNVLLTFRRSKNQKLLAIQEAARHTLILWIQLLCLLANNTVTRVEIRSNTTLISSVKLPEFASPAVLRGLKKWNDIVSQAKSDTRKGYDNNYGFWHLLEIVRDMEAPVPVHVWPLMARMWDLKREYSDIDLVAPRHTVNV